MFSVFLGRFVFALTGRHPLSQKNACLNPYSTPKPLNRNYSIIVMYIFTNVRRIPSSCAKKTCRWWNSISGQWYLGDLPFLLCSLECFGYRTSIQWEFQDPKMEVLYHIRSYKIIFCWDIPLHRPYIGLIHGRYLQFRILKFPLIDEDPRSPWPRRSEGLRHDTGGQGGSGGGHGGRGRGATWWEEMAALVPIPLLHIYIIICMCVTYFKNHADLYTTHTHIYICIYIYVCVCVCVCDSFDGDLAWFRITIYFHIFWMGWNLQRHRNYQRVIRCN